MPKILSLSFPELRTIVCAVHNQGQRLRDDNQTFSHRHMGNELQSLADRIDEVVIGGEYETNFQLCAGPDRMALKDRISALEAEVKVCATQRDEAEGVLARRENMLAEMKAMLGDITISDREVVSRVHDLVFSPKQSRKSAKKRKR